MSHRRTSVSGPPFSVIFCLGIVAWLSPGPAVSQERTFRRGDANLDGRVEISDALHILAVLFTGEAPAGCDDAADLNDDGRLTVTDPIAGLRYLFLGGPEPPAPWGSCGPDPTADGLNCLQFPPCAARSCLDQEVMNGILGESIATSFCIPPGMLEFAADPFAVSVCPTAAAGPCGPRETPGCPAQITSMTGSVDAPARRLVIHFEGKIDDLPLEITESIFNSTTDCLTDLHGAEPALPFSFDVVFPLQVTEDERGARVISGLGEPAIENPSLEATVSGGIACRLFQAGQQALVDFLLGFLLEAIRTLARDLPEVLAGAQLCGEE